MAGRQLRFVHASDLHLEQPLHGVTEVPDHLRDLFLDAATWRPSACLIRLWRKKPTSCCYPAMCCKCALAELVRWSFFGSNSTGCWS